MADKLIFITGVGSGLGQALAAEALKQGWRVAGTVRSDSARQEFEAQAPGKAFGQILDLAEASKAADAICEIERAVGPIEVLVNNAGYGLEAPLEEAPFDALRRQLEVNFFAPVALIQAVLPFMRKRRSGRILNITSVGGLVALPGLGAYNASKFALEGIGEAVGKEVRPLGIFVTAIEPGAFRTEWAGRSLMRAPRRIADYDEVFDPQRTARSERSGRQRGDPAKAAQAILQIAEAPNPPAHLALGHDAVDRIYEKFEGMRAEMELWRDLSLSTDFE